MMAQNIIFPNVPLFMVDRGWKSPHKGFGLRIVRFGGDGKVQTSRRRNPQHAAAVLPQRPMERASFQYDSEKASPAPKSKVASASDQNFEFVNIAGSFRDRAPETRKLVRSHVMKGTHRNQKPRRKPSKERTDQSMKIEKLSPSQGGSDPETNTLSPPELAPTLPGTATSWYGVSPCIMKPQFYNLLNYCK